MTDEIKLYNTKTKTIDVFVPLLPKIVKIYSCGPTVYHYQHLGNMRAAVFADTLRRMFVSHGYEVKHVINITDVGHNTDDGDEGEDKMEKGSRREGKSVWEIAKNYTDAYFQDLTRLGIPLDAYIFPRATDHIQEQIGLVHALELLGYTYKIQDGIYFDTSKFKAYRDFARLDIEGLQSGARVEENKEKRNITDFALWKFSSVTEKRQMEWDSPWGKGFPGWHIECSAMSMKYLGNHFDVHTGGIEHIPVHHTNEIAQSESATGVTYVNYWMHNNHLLDTTGKMSKSTGEFLTISELVKKNYSPLAYRYFLMGAHYRKELAFSYEALDAATTAYEKLIQFCKAHASKDSEVNQDVDSMNHFNAALTNDLNTSQAVGVMWNMIKSESIDTSIKYKTLLEMDKILGLGLAEIKKEEIEITDEMKALLDARSQARKDKNFIESDRIRDEIVRRGFVLKDTEDGQILTQ